MKPLRLDAEAEEELAAAMDWYERHRPGLGGEFLQAVAATLQTIPDGPATFGLVPGVPENLPVRRALVQRFPYAVVFLELPDEIRVLAVAHGHRRPGYWRERLPR